MNIVLAVGVALALAVVVLFIILAVKSQSGAALGLVNGKLAHCPAKPNCVCSEYKEDDAHYIAPIPFNGTNDGTNKIMPIMTSTISSMGGKVVRQTDDYLAATFSSSLFHFVDDLEIRVDTANGLIQIRSAARVGQSDLGVNRKRVEKLLGLIEAKLKQSN